MKRYERLNAILELLAQDAKLDVDTAAPRLGVSEATIRRDLEYQGQAFFLGPDRNHLRHFLQQVVQREPGPFQLELRGFDLGEIEDVVNEIQ